MSRLQADSLLLFVSLIWGSAFVAQHYGMASIGPYFFTGLRFLLGALIVAPLAWREWSAGRRQFPQRRFRGRDLAAVGGLGGLLFLGAAFQQAGIVSTSVTHAGFLTILFVPMVPLLSWGLLGERPHWSVWPAGAGCVAGTWLLTGAERIAIGPGDAWVLAGTVFWALHVLLIGRVATRIGMPLVVAAGQFLVVAVAGCGCALLIEPLSWSKVLAAAPALAYAGFLSVGVAFTAQVLAQRYTPPADAAVIMTSETVFAALFGAWLLGERLDFMGILGCLLILGGILLVQLLPLWQNRQPDKIRTEPTHPV